MIDAIKIGRRALYQRVWSEPVTKLAREYGLSDVGFAKLCKRNEVPRPPRGFWSRQAAGSKTVTTPLPRADADWEIEITPFAHDIEDPALRAEVEKELAAGMPERTIEVPESLRGAHPLVSQSLNALELAQKDEYGIVNPPATGCLDVAVSRDAVRRALRIMDALIKAFEASGHQVRVSGGKQEDRTVVELMETRVAFGIRAIVIEKKEEADHDVNLQGRPEFSRSRFAAKIVPSGNLCLEIEPRRKSRSGGTGNRRRWSDGQRGRLEGLLNQFMVGVIREATAKREERLAAEKWERERREEAKIEAEREAARAAAWAKIQAERKRVQKLRANAVDWVQSRNLRAYIATVRQEAVASGQDVSEGSEVGTWLRWATDQADRLDPLKESPPSILDEEEKYKPLDQERFW
jgi:hypothetical protein